MLSLLSHKKIDGVSIFSEYVSSNSIEELLELKEKKNIKNSIKIKLQRLHAVIVKYDLFNARIYTIALILTLSQCMVLQDLHPWPNFF